MGDLSKGPALDACEKHGRPKEGCRDCFIRGLHAKLDAWREAHAAQTARAEEFRQVLECIAATSDDHGTRTLASAILNEPQSRTDEQRAALRDLRAELAAGAS